MNYFKRLFNSLINKQHYETSITGMVISSDEQDDNYLVDFRRGFISSGGINGNVVSWSGESYSSSSPNSSTPKKIKIKPKAVFDELERIPTMWSLEHIDEKIEIMKDKAELVSQEYTKRELNDFVSRLEHRKKLRDKDTDRKTFLSYFQQFDTTTDEKIEALLEKYDLVMKEADIFIPEFPDEAVKIMKLFNRKVERVTGKKPVYYVIAEDSNFEKKYERRDPILLAQSPFGFYYHILGAWDTEMLYLPEL